MHRIIKIFIFSTILFTAIYNTNAHPIHLGIINIEIANNGETRFLIHLNEEDLMHYLFETNNYTNDISTDSLKNIIKQYLNINLIISINGITSQYQLKMKTNEGDLAILELEIPTINNLTSIELTNKIFHDVFPDQTTLLFFTAQNKTITQKMDFKNNQFIIKL